MFEILLKLDKKTAAMLDKKLQKYRTVVESNEGYEAGQVRNYVSMIARTAYALGQKDIKLPLEEPKDEM